MKSHLVLFAALSALTAGVVAQSPEGEAPAPKVTYERMVDADAEPQNWLTYSGSYMSQRHSLLTEIAPENVKNLDLKWTFRSKTPDKHEATPIVVNGILYTIQNPNDVVAMDAATGKVIWTFAYTPDPIARNCCG
jgi:glucose dehydrogenase